MVPTINDSLKFIIYEIWVFFSFSWRDLSATIIPGSIFAIGAIRNSDLPLTSIISQSLFLLSWLTLYIYFFTLSNQITGVYEDQINKPDRPLPSGKVTLAGAALRWVLTLSLFLGIAVYERTVLPETISWVFTTAFLSLTCGGRHWFGKNCLALAVGTWSLLSGSWKAISPMTPQMEGCVVAVSIWAACIAQIADLRDIKGDALIGRKTLPLAFGDAMSRYIIAYFFLPVCFCALWMGGVISLAPILLTAAHIFLGYRVICAGGKRYDHKTYMMVTYIFCLILALIAAQGLELELLHRMWWETPRNASKGRWSNLQILAYSIWTRMAKLVENFPSCIRNTSDTTTPHFEEVAMTSPSVVLDLFGPNS